MTKDKQTFLADCQQHLGRRDDRHFAASQLLTLHQAASARPGGTFLELGTDGGQATNVILEACESHGGRLVSVDIVDCSDAASSPQWTFVRADSVDRKAIVAGAPFLREGIDLVYVDSKHTAEHVEQEIYTWFPLMNPGAVMYFDDIDSGPYLAGARKDSPFMEIANRRIRCLIEEVFYRNTDKLELEMQFGSTGLAALRKRVGRDAMLAPIRPRLRPRRNVLLARIQRKLFGGFYEHRRGVAGPI